MLNACQPPGGPPVASFTEPRIASVDYLYETRHIGRRSKGRDDTIAEARDERREDSWRTARLYEVTEPVGTQ